jgi:hypothetical protein
MSAVTTTTQLKLVQKLWSRPSKSNPYGIIIYCVTKAPFVGTLLGGMQIIGDTLGGGGLAEVSPNITWGEEGWPKCHVTIFYDFF